MAKAKSARAKYAEGRGTGHGPDYRPWILAQEKNSFGACMVMTDWKHKRRMHFLSQGEAMFYYLTRFDDRVVDYREQFPLPLEETTAIARRLGSGYTGNLGEPLTTDALIDYADGSQMAVSIKAERKTLEGKRAFLRNEIERRYWLSEGVPFINVFKEDLNKTMFQNLLMVMRYYDPETVHDDSSRIKHDIAVKRLRIDLGKELLDIRKIKEEYYNGRSKDRTGKYLINGTEGIYDAGCPAGGHHGHRTGDQQTVHLQDPIFRGDKRVSDR